ncbi:peptidoglycan-binding protein [Kineococcus sp. NUM-3379]
MSTEVGTGGVGERNRPGNRRGAGRRVLAGGIVVGTVVAAGAVALTTRGDGGQEAAAEGPPRATAQVTRTDLVEREDVAGTLGYAGGRTLSAGTAGTWTSLAEEGSTLTSGGVLWRIDERPTVLLRGELPAYRRLAPGTGGEDVRQFEQALRELGFTGFTVDEEYTARTARAVRRWQEELGAVRDGTVDLGDVVFTPTDVRVAQWEVGVGDAAQAGQAALVTTGTARVVRLRLEVEDLPLARRDARVEVVLPDGSRTGGRVTSVGTVAEEDSDEEGEATVEVEVEVALDPADAAAGLDGAPVTVSMESERHAGVLTVPVGALLALAEGGFGVRVVEGAGTRVVAVEPGASADGRVEVSGRDVTEGARVEVPSS